MSEAEEEVLPVVRNLVLVDTGYYHTLDMIEAGLAASRARLEAFKALEDEFRKRRQDRGNAAEALKKPFAVIDPTGADLHLTEVEVRTLVIKQEERVRLGEAALLAFKAQDQHGYTLVRANDAMRLAAIDALVSNPTKLTFEIYKDKAGEFRVRVKEKSEVLFSTEGYETKPQAQAAIEKLKVNITGAEIIDNA